MFSHDNARFFVLVSRLTSSILTFRVFRAIKMVPSSEEKLVRNHVRTRCPARPIDVAARPFRKLALDRHQVHQRCKARLLGGDRTTASSIQQVYRHPANGLLSQINQRRSTLPEGQDSALWRLRGSERNEIGRFDDAVRPMIVSTPSVLRHIGPPSILVNNAAAAQFR